MHHDRIENKRYEKNIKLFKWGALITLFVAIFRIILDPAILNGGGKTADFFMMLLPIGMFFQYRQTAKKWGGQFIEWTEDEVSFKSRKYDHTTIKFSDIKSINIRFDYIEIDTPEKKYEINIEDYTKYEDRIRLKSNFEQVKEKLSTIA